MSESQTEIEEAFSQCLNIIDNPPAEHRIAKHAIQGAILLSIHRKDLISKIYFKLLQVVKDRQTYRLNPRVCAVREISYLTYHDEQLAPPAIQFLQSLLPCDDFNSQQVARAAVVSLTRIARMHVVYQPNVIQTIRQIYQNSSKKSLRAEALIGIARMAQRNHSLRGEFVSEFIKCATDQNEHTKCAAILSLGHAVMALENVPRDEGLEMRCFEVCSNALRVPRHNYERHYDTDWHLVHLCAVKSLALLVRASPSTWWTPVAQLYERILSDASAPWLSKCGVLWMCGKLCALLASSSHDYRAARQLLLDALKHEHAMLIEAAVHGLVHLSLAHDEQYAATREWIRSKLGPSFKHTTGQNLALYLRPWCKLIARAVNPLFHASIARTAPLPAAAFSHNVALRPPERVDEDLRRSVREPEPVVEKTFKLDMRQIEQTVRPLARDDQQLWRLCGEFSAPVLESLVAMMRDSSLLEDQQLVQHVKLLIIDYKNKVPHKSAADPALQLHTKELAQMDLLARETAVTILKYPHVLDDAGWLSSVKQRFAAPTHPAPRTQFTVQSGYPTSHPPGPVPPFPPPNVVPQFSNQIPMSGVPGIINHPGAPNMLGNQPGPTQQQLLQLLSLTNPALLMQLTGQPPLALLQSLQQQAVLTALQQNAVTNPARDPRLNFPPPGPAPGPHYPPEHYAPHPRGSYQRGRGGYRGGRGGYDQGPGHKRARDDAHQGPDPKRAKMSHPGPDSVNQLPGPRAGQSESGSAEQRDVQSSNTSLQTATEPEAPLLDHVVTDHVTSQLTDHVTEHVTGSATNVEPDVVALGSDSEDDLPGPVSASLSDSDSDEEGEISSDNDQRTLPGSETQPPSRGTPGAEAKKRKRKKKRREAKKKPSEVCKYYLSRSCAKGLDCPFAHTGLKLDEVCRFYRSGVCRRGDDCMYSHDLSHEACKHMVQGACNYGERCRFSHDPAVVEAQRRVTPAIVKRVKTAEPVTPVNTVNPITYLTPVNTVNPATHFTPVNVVPRDAPPVASRMAITPSQPLVVSHRDPRLDPSATGPTASAVREIVQLDSARPASPQAPPLTNSFDLSLLTALQQSSAPKPSAADELKKLI